MHTDSIPTNQTDNKNEMPTRRGRTRRTNCAFCSTPTMKQQQQHQQKEEEEQQQELTSLLREYLCFV